MRNTLVLSPPPPKNGRGYGSRRSLTSGGVAAIVFVVVALASTPAAAQTVTVSATGNCGGIPANCGTGGDRDTSWPGLQVDEGDLVTFSQTVSPVITSGVLGVNYSLSGSARNTADLREPNGNAFASNHAVIVGALGTTINSASGSTSGIRTRDKTNTMI